MAKRKRDLQFWESCTENGLSWRAYYNRLVELSISMFDWKNVPDTIDVRFMELALFSEGHAVFFEDKDLGFLCLRCTIGGGFNVYRIPLKRNVITSCGYHKRLDIKNSVLIWNNYLHTNSMLDVEIFARKLYELDRAIDVNARAQKTPVLIVCDENERLTMKNMYKEYDGNAPVIWGDKALKTSELKVLKTDAPYVADKLYTLKTQIWNEALTYLGINNVNVTKKERLITDEVQRNQGGTLASRNSRLGMRQKACEEINKMFGLNMSVEFKEDTRVADDYMIEDLLKNNREGGDKNE